MARVSKKAAAAAPVQDARGKALDTAISQIEKKYGAGTIMRLGEGNSLEVSAVSTGSLTLDLALGALPQRQHAAQLLLAADQRKHDRQLTVHRRTQQRTRLRQKQRGIQQRMPHRSTPERRIVLLALAWQAGRLLIRADIQRPHDHATSLHPR